MSIVWTADVYMHSTVIIPHQQACGNTMPVTVAR